MKNFLCLFILLMFISCSSTFKLSNAYNYNINKFQVDSICKVEKIPLIDIDKWISIPFIDSENDKQLYQYTYIKNVKNNKQKIQYTYICTDFDTIYNFKKRILIKE